MCRVAIIYLYYMYLPVYMETFIHFVSLVTLYSIKLFTKNLFVIWILNCDLMFIMCFVLQCVCLCLCVFFSSFDLFNPSLVVVFVCPYLVYPFNDKRLEGKRYPEWSIADPTPFRFSHSKFKFNSKFSCVLWILVFWLYNAYASPKCICSIQTEHIVKPALYLLGKYLFSLLFHSFIHIPIKLSLCFIVDSIENLLRFGRSLSLVTVHNSHMKCFCEMS